jgi:hypothetical protein
MVEVNYSMEGTILFLDLAIETGSPQLERVAHGDFGGAEPCHGKILKFKRFKFGVLGGGAADRQVPNG